ncbi:MAG: polymer-forming cytoskeletal protein [Clostridia bacterium]|nr:polymer-forming cytoskeletal protein [Clostridia bacterium]MDD4048578.1 polymer-forming cytoskeletal protein [Clostridia bacterium]
MFGKKRVEEINIEKIDTLIGKGSVFSGNIEVSGTIRIDGGYKGDIKAKGDLVVGESGKIEATISARNIYIGGYIKGNIKAEEKVELASSGRLYGDIVVGKLIIEEGAVYKGNCEMVSERGEKKKTEKKESA